MVWHDPRHDISANQSVTHVITWIRRPPEQETEITEAIPSTNDKLALESTQQKKAEVGWAHRLVGRPAHGPHRLKPDTWRLTIGCQCRFLEVELQNTPLLAVALSYKYKGG